MYTFLETPCYTLFWFRVLCILKISLHSNQLTGNNIIWPSDIDISIIKVDFIYTCMISPMFNFFHYIVDKRWLFFPWHNFSMEVWKQLDMSSLHWRYSTGNWACVNVLGYSAACSLCCQTRVCVCVCVRVGRQLPRSEDVTLEQLVLARVKLNSVVCRVTLWMSFAYLQTFVRNYLN